MAEGSIQVHVSLTPAASYPAVHTSTEVPQSLSFFPLPTCSLYKGGFVGLISAPRVLSCQTIMDERNNYAQRKPGQVRHGGVVPQPGTEGKNSQAWAQARANVTPVVQERGLFHRPKLEHRPAN